MTIHPTCSDVYLTLGACTSGTVVLCVYLTVTTLAAAYLFYVENRASLHSSWHFHGLGCVAFVENTLFKNYGIVCSPPSLPDRALSGHKRQQWLLFNAYT